MEEIWKDIKGYEGLYRISNQGNIKSLDRIVTTKAKWTRIHKGRKMCPTICKNGYKVVTLHDAQGNKKKKYIHQLVAQNFIGDYDLKNHINTVNHIDGNKLNNSWDNLEFISAVGNIAHAIRMGLNLNIGVFTKSSKLSLQDIIYIRSRWLQGESAVNLAQQYHVGHASINRIVHNIRYKDPEYQKILDKAHIVRRGGVKSRVNKLTLDQVHEIRDRYKMGESAANIAKDFPICVKQVFCILQNNSYYDENYTYQPHHPEFGNRSKRLLH